MRLIAMLILILISPVVSAKQQVTVEVRGNMVHGHVINQANEYGLPDGLDLDMLSPAEVESYSIPLQRYAKTRITVRYPSGKGCQFVFSAVMPASEAGYRGPGFAPNQGYVGPYPGGFISYPGFVPYQGTYNGSYGNTVGTVMLTTMPITSDSICHVDENATLTAR